jgi:hypothetical protein
MHEEAIRDLRVLIPTNRDVYRALSYGMVIDFEDSVAELSDTDLVSVPVPSRRARIDALRHGRRLKPIKPPRSEYDICLLVAMDPWYAPSLTQIRDVRKIARKVVVYLYDSWLADLHVLRRHRHIWSMVDHAFVSFNHSVEAYEDALDCPVTYLPQAIHEKRFHPRRTRRPIDVLSLGRKHPSVHQVLRDLARDEEILYFFQTAHLPQAVDLIENQELLGQLCQASRVQVHWSVESTDSARAEGGGPITARWFEAAASGSVVVGQKPNNPEFTKLFPYDGFVRRLDPERPDETKRLILDGIRKNDDREERIRLADHVRVAHTWKARWREIAAICSE